MGEQEDRAKRRRTRLLQRYVLNPPVKLAVWTGLVPGYGRPARHAEEGRSRHCGKRQTPRCRCTLHPGLPFPPSWP